MCDGRRDVPGAPRVTLGEALYVSLLATSWTLAVAVTVLMLGYAWAWW